MGYLEITFGNLFFFLSINTCVCARASGQPQKIEIQFPPDDEFIGGGERANGQRSTFGVKKIIDRHFSGGCLWLFFEFNFLPNLINHSLITLAIVVAGGWRANSIKSRAESSGRGHRRRSSSSSGGSARGVHCKLKV